MMRSSFFGSVLCLVLCVFSTTTAFAHEDATWAETQDPPKTNLSSADDSNFRLTLATEFGLLSVISHKLQQSEEGTNFDFVNDGGQELFTPFLRASAELDFKDRHTVTMLYQPIDLKTRVRLSEDVSVDGITFPEGKMMDLRYGFDFFRLSYMYDVARDPDLEISLGGGFQMRIATIEFVPIDGSEGRINRDLGPVPLLKLRVHRNLASGWFYGTEIDGFYANIRILNGDTEAEVTGAIYDGSLRAGKRIGPGLDAFLNLRFIGGGGEGTSPESAREEPGDGYVKNWLHASTISLGFFFEPAMLVK